MKKALTIIFVLSFCFINAQKPNKTINDSVFNVGDIIKIPTVLYDICCYGCPDGMSLNSKDSLNKIAKFILKYPKITFQIESYTDSRGDALKNKKLSNDRANSIRDYVIKNFDADSTKLITKGFGKSDLLIPDKEIAKAKTKQEKEELHAQNRRTQLKVIAKE